MAAIFSRGRWVNACSPIGYKTSSAGKARLLVSKAWPALCNTAIHWEYRPSPNTIYHPLDVFTVPLHSPNSRHLPAVRVVQWDWQRGLKNLENSHWSGEPIMQRSTRQFQSIDQPIINGWCQSIGSHVSYPTVSSIATRLGLCSSLTIGMAVVFSILNQTKNGCRFPYKMFIFSNANFFFQISLIFVEV